MKGYQYYVKEGQHVGQQQCLGLHINEIETKLYTVTCNMFATS